MADQAGKRRLPLWKSEVVAVDHSEHNGDTNRIPKQNTRTKISRKPIIKVEKHETKRRKVSPTHKNDTDLSGKRLLSSFDRMVKVEPLMSSEEEEDDDDEVLTMEDLMSIAKEYTEADETNLQGKYIIDTPEVNLKLRASVKNESKSESYFNTTKVKPQEEFSFHKPPEKMPCEKTLAGPPTPTGDAAQDMLNLFLGPLLKKPQMEEKKLDLSTTKEEVIGPGLKNYVSNVSVPLEKRKCSLKDKVTMLLQ